MHLKNHPYVKEPIFKQIPVYFPCLREIDLRGTVRVQQIEDLFHLIFRVDKTKENLLIPTGIYIEAENNAEDGVLVMALKRALKTKNFSYLNAIIDSGGWSEKDLQVKIPGMIAPLRESHAEEWLQKLVNHPRFNPDMRFIGENSSTPVATFLHLFCIHLNKSLIKIFLDHSKIDVNALDKDGKTPLDVLDDLKKDQNRKFIYKLINHCCDRRNGTNFTIKRC
ncbi:MAG: hypothetical protein K0S74_1753 [Chlamydiales bacterium]|nr:hypothetical protein [Chlamydiales bacterium]